MARILFAVWPFVGHINPFLSVAKALQERGHSVAFYTSRKERGRLEPEGVTVFPFDHLIEEPIWETVQAAETSGSHGWHSPKLLMRACRDWLAGTVRDQVADIRDICKQWQPDLIVPETAMWGPIVVLNETGPVPVAILTTLMGCLIPGRDAPPWGPGLLPPRTFKTRLIARAVTRLGDVLAVKVRKMVNDVRAENGLPRMERSVNAHMATLPMYLIGSIPELDYNRHDLPPSVHYVGPCVYNRATDAPPPPWLDELPTDRPWVHVTEGTAHYQDPFVLRAAIRGLADLPIQVVMTTGPQRDLHHESLGSIPANTRVEQWAPHSDLLPRCAAIVTTGGAGTVITALRHAVPLVIVPTHWDKADNAQRIVDAGVGLRLSPKQCTPEGLRAAVRRLLDEPSFRINARRIAATLAANSGPDRAAELLEALAQMHKVKSPVLV